MLPAFLCIAVLAGDTVSPAPRAIDPQPGAARLLVERLPGAESCPSDNELKDAVARRLGFDPFHPRATREIRCTVRRAEGSFRAHIEIGGSSVAAPATGRDLISRGDDCAELAEALELAVGIAINPLVIARSTATRPPPKATLPAPPTAKGAPLAVAALPPQAVPPPSAAPAPIATPPSSATTPPAEIARDAARSPRPSVTPPASGLTQTSVPRSAPAFGIGADAGVGAAVGLGPGVAPTVAIGASLRRRDLSLDVGARIVGQSSADVETGSVTAWMWSASAGPCVHRGVLAACAVASGGALRARGDGFVVNVASAAPYLAVGARAVADVPIGRRLRVRWTGEMAVPLMRIRLTVDGRDAWTSPRVNALSSLGLAVNFD